MQYAHIVKAIFIERPNRFIAYCEVNGVTEKVHVKNTGRCKELLISGIEVYLEEHDDPKRKTRYSLITVKKGKRLINMDSQAPNKVAEEALLEGIIHLPGLNEPLTCIKREYTYGNSRFDFYIETNGQKALMEVKGVTLEEDDEVMFPDAKTERGVKHVEELIKAAEEDYKAYILFVIQMKGVKSFRPHAIRHPEFAEVLKRAEEKGVHVLAYECHVTESTLEITKPVPIIL